MRIAIVTDSWAPQENSLVYILKATVHSLRNIGHEIRVVSAEGLPTFPVPGCPDIRFASKPQSKVERELDTFAPDAIHIVTEGPVGLAARRYCIRRKLNFTSSCNPGSTWFLRSCADIPAALGFLWLRWFHRRSKAVLVPTEGMRRQLEQYGFREVSVWRPGVDTERFRPEKTDYACIKRPLHLYVGQISLQRNLENFLRLDVPGSKWVIGDGPLRVDLERCYPDVKFLGAKSNDDMHAYYNCADVLVYPGRGETFVLPILEAMACGIPVAAYPIEGAADILEQGISDALDHDLERACAAALSIGRDEVRQHALRYSAEPSAAQFLKHLYPARTIVNGAAVSSSIARLP